MRRFSPAQRWLMTRKQQVNGQPTRADSITQVGVGGALAGRGADLFVIDDPHSEQDIKANSRATFDNAWSWFQTGPLQRLMPGGRIIVVMTRWSLVDLTGRLLSFQARNPDAEPWELVELPAILFEDTEKEKSLWPEQWPLKELKAKKEAMDPRYWNAQYMQQPTLDSAAFIKRSHWRIWEPEDPPSVNLSFSRGTRRTKPRQLLTTQHAQLGESGITKKKTINLTLFC
jgi:hypothetical protein